MRRMGAAWMFLLLVAPAVGAQPRVNSQQKSVGDFEKRLSEQRLHLQHLSSREGALLREFDQDSRKLDGLAEEISRLEMEEVENERDIRATSTEVEQLKFQIESTQEEIGRRLRRMYMGGTPNYLHLYLAAGTLEDLRGRNRLVRQWLAYDQERVDQYKDRVRQLQSLQRNLESDRRRQEKTLSDLSRNKSELDRERAVRNQMLAMVQSQQDFYKRSIRELEDAAKDLERLVKTLEAARAEQESHFAQMKGKLPLPVRGALEQSFGPYLDTRLKTTVHHKGVDLRAKTGAPIRAVFDGRIVHSGWFTGYGKILILDHGGGYFSLYAHASKLLKKAGDVVAVGEPIAEVGDTSSLKGAYLYFELRYKGISQDPWPWFAHER
ncbi:MAG TPA: peptidoglycan DD-metalloendopeptidase family protein [Bdellovibrionota bacterium]|nr:peptidoglycan DD-metalloendopeptidase family protein [Bdellovibrionota bacterium]